MNRFYRSLLLTGVVAAGLAGCGDDVTVLPPPVPPPPQVRGVTVTPTNVTVSPGSTQQMTANVTADAGATVTIVWSSSDAARATVDNSGLVTIPASATSGAVSITATATAGGSTAAGSATLNVVGTTVTGVVITPPTASININQSVDFEAAVQGTNNPAQTVVWSTLDATIVSLDQNGVATGVATGTANIKACSTVDGTKCGVATVVVLAPNPATVEIQTVTFTNGAGQEVPVVLTNVFGQIQIHINVDNGAQQLDHIDALIDGVVVASQTFSTSNPAPKAGLSAAPRQVVLSVNTMQVRQNGNVFVPVTFNGNRGITANLFVQGQSTPVASNAIPVVMNNVDAMIQPGTGGSTFAPTAGAGNTVTVGTTVWFGNTATVDVSTQFIAFQNTLPSAVPLGSSTCGAPAAGTITIVGTPATGIVVSGTLPCTGTEDAAVTPGAGPAAGISYAPATSGPDGTGLVAPTQWSTVGSVFVVNGDNRFNLITPSLTTLATLAIDNRAPSVEIAGDGVATLITVAPALVAFNDLFDQFWISNTYQFTVFDAVTNPLGDLAAADGGVGLDGAPTARHYDGAVPACDATDLPTQTGADFAETLTSAAPGTDFEQACTYAKDLLGNEGTSGGSNTFGVDYASGVGGKGALPDIRLAGVNDATVNPPIAPSTTSSVSTLANTSIYGNLALNSPFPAFPATDVWGLEAIDDRAGFDLNGAVGAPAAASQTLARLAQTGAASCALFGTLLPQTLSDVYVRTNPTLVALDCALGIGYYTYTGSVIDRAGNPSVTITRNFARDDVAAPTVAGFSATNLPYTPGATGDFAFFAQDDLEVIGGTILLNIPIVTAPGVGLRYPLGTVQGLGTKWDATLTGLITNGTATIPYMYFRIDESCSAAGVPYAGCPAPGAKITITAPLTTVTADYDVVNTTDAGQLPTSASGAVADVADQLSASTATPPFLPAFFQVPPAAAGLGLPEPWTAGLLTNELQSWDLDLLTTVGTALAKQVGITSTTAAFFEGAQLFRINVTNEWVLCGDFPAPSPNDNGPDRVWTYTLLLPTTGACTGATFAGANTWRALGRKGGAGLFTPTR